MRHMIIIALVVGSMLAHAQSPQRLPIMTGFSSGYQFERVATRSWLVDQSTVYRSSAKSIDQWEPLPDLYRCEPATIVSASPQRVIVLARRPTPSDTSWWVFRSTPNERQWLDSTSFRPNGRYVGRAWGMMLFSSSPDSVPMVLNVYDTLGDLRGSIALNSARNTRAVTMRQCGDSIVVLDRITGRAVCETIRGGAGVAVGAWTSRVLPDVIDGVVGTGDAFVYMTSAGVFVDHAGQVRAVKVLNDRLQDLCVDSLRGARIARGTVEYSDNITTSHVDVAYSRRILTPSTDQVISVLGRRSYVVARPRGILQWYTTYLDAGAAEQWRDIPLIAGSRSRGPRQMLSGATVVIADHFLVAPFDEVRAAICRVIPGASQCDTSMQLAVPFTHEVLRRVGDDVWLSTRDGVITYPNLDTVRQLPVYDVVEENGRVIALTARGIEGRDVGSDKFRVLVPDVPALAIAVMGDTVFAFRSIDITAIEPEAQIVVDAYDRFGSPYFVQQLVADSVIARSLRFRSASVINGAIVVNCSRKLVVSSDAAITWNEIDVDGELTTRIDAAGEHPVAWMRASNGTQGPALMITPDRWVMQSVELRTGAPVEACASMPGWFVFSTSDGVWCVEQSISSIADGNVGIRGGLYEGSADAELLVDLLGRVFSRDQAPRGFYFHVVRSGGTWHVRQTLHIP